MEHQAYLVDPVAIAILREAVRLDGLSERSGRSINVDVAQIRELEGRGLLVKDSARGLWHASADGRIASGV